MAVRESDQKRFEAEELKKSLALSDEHLRDNDWLERISFNPDWQKLCVLYKKETEKNKPVLEELKKKLCTEPLTYENASLLRQTIMLHERDLENLKRFIEFPKNELKRLNEIRAQYPDLRKKLNVLEGVK